MRTSLCCDRGDRCANPGDLALDPRHNRHVTVTSIDPRLLDHLVIEFGDHGKRAVEFLRTAHRLLELDSASTPPRLPETVAYCLREAMKTIPASQELGGGGLWRTASRAVSDARRRYELVRGVPGEDEQGALDDLLGAIDDLDLVHSQEGIHERRLIAIMLNRTGALPVASGTAPVQGYQDLLGAEAVNLCGAVDLSYY